MNSHRLRKCLALACALLFLTLTAQADITLPKIIQDHMIIQQGVTNNIWGTAEAGEKITLTFAGQTHTTKADADGKWQVKLQPLKASSNPQELTVAGNNTIIIKDVLIGEVWLAAGQSNMVSGIKQVPGSQRQLFIDQKQNKRIRAYIGDRWYMLPEQALHTSAVGFFFALKLEQTLEVPVAYVVVAQCGSKIEPFVPPAEAEEAKLGKKSSGIYNARVEPLTPCSIKGVIWYQGESNRGCTNYFASLDALHRGWSRAFRIPQLPFYQVQIAPYSKATNITSLISDSVWSAQYQAAKEIPGIGVIPLHDTGISVQRIHPRSKQPVGERLAAMALRNQYGKDVVATGPVFAKATSDGGKVVVSFNHIDEGLITKDGLSPSFFELSADDKSFAEATATIKGHQVVVASDSIPDPKFVRMGWFDTAIPNLQDKNGWPAFSFPSQTIEANGKHLFILSGQSNMVGMKPEQSFTPAVVKAFGKENIIVVKDAHSGQSIRSWCHSNLEDPPPTVGRVPKVRGLLYKSLMKRVDSAIKDQPIKTITFVWMQGESDLRNTAYDAYLEALLKQLQTDLDSQDINVVIGRISDCGLDSQKRLKEKKNIRKIQAAFAESLARGAWIDTDDLNDKKKGDKIVHDLHYTADGYRTLGERFAKEAIKLINTKPKD